ncbi:MAG TPA: hypothetical protein VIQ29_25355 [Ancylobacter sp.]
MILLAGRQRLGGAMPTYGTYLQSEIVAPILCQILATYEPTMKFSDDTVECTQQVIMALSYHLTVEPVSALSLPEPLVNALHELARRRVFDNPKAELQRESA